MRMTDDDGSRRGAVGEAQLTLKSYSVVRGESHCLHVRGTMHPMTSARQLSGTGFALRDPWPWVDFAGLTRDGEAKGYSAVFLPEIYGRDALASLTALAGETHSLLLGTGIVPMDARTPQLTAMAAATLQERSAGRGILGLGAGLVAEGALDRLRELVVACKAAVRGEPAAVGDQRITLTLIPETPPQVWIAALGPRAVELAGEVADGVLLNWCPPERVLRVKEQLARGADRAGRDPADITIAGYVRACVEDDRPEALSALQAAAGEYASYPPYARQFENVGLGDEARQAANAHAAGHPEGVPEALVRAVTLAGDAAAARSRLQTYREAGLDLPVVYPVPAGPDALGSVRTTLAALAP
jgi:5,10-methylenetetrahydromethanopterin reductase